MLWVSRNGTNSGLSNVNPYSISELNHFGLLLTYLVKKAIEVYMQDTSGTFLEEYVFAVPVPKPAKNMNLSEKAWVAGYRETHPRTYPTMDMTAQERVYLNLAANHAPVSGNISTNHSCKTGGSLSPLCQLPAPT